MFKAGSIFYALAIATIIGIITSSVILCSYYSHLRLQYDEQGERLTRNAISGIYLLTDDSDITPYDSPISSDLFNEGRDSVRLTKKSWGAFDVNISYAFCGTQHEIRIAQCGWECDGSDNTALVLADMDKPLSICGDVRLKGDCYLPRAGVKRAYIEGQSYSGDKMVYGNIFDADRYLPAYNEELAKKINDLFHSYSNEGDSIFTISSFLPEDSLSNSFLHHTLILKTNGPVRIDASLSGNIILLSDQEITISRNSDLLNIIIAAPKIKIEDDVQGSFQAFARDSLIIGKNVKLGYPSVLGLLSDRNSPDNSFLLFDEGSSLKGDILGCSLAKDARKTVSILINKGTIITGNVYCTGMIDHAGEVDGTVTCAKFSLTTSSASYENHLLNAIIDRSQLPEGFVSSAFTRPKHSIKEVVQWLN